MPNHRLARLVFSLAAIMVPSAIAAQEVLPYARVLVSRPGVYKVTYEDLFATEPTGFEAATVAMGLRQGGEPVPIWVADGGDGRLGPGEWIEFIGDRPRGEVGYYHEYSVFNVYQLSLRDPEPLRMVAESPPAASGAADAASLIVRDHLEEDRQLLRFASRDREAHEVWYWARMSQIDPEPFRQQLVFDARDTESRHPVSVRINLRGWSKPRFQRGERPPDHRVEVLLNGDEIGHGEWNQQEEITLELELPGASLAESGNELAIRVPKRFSKGDTPIIDVVALNWIELSYPRLPAVAATQVRFEVDRGDQPAVVALDDLGGAGLVAYGEDATRIELPEGARRVGVPAGDGTGDGYTLYVAPIGGLAQVDAVDLDDPSFLASTENQADYIVITHPKLRWALQPLIELHEERGLSVRVVLIQDVYDEFNFGMPHPRSIRDFLRFAYQSWARPAPRFVLLAGDASWDARNEVVVDENYAASTFLPRLGTHYSSTGGQPYYAGAQLNNRNLIPTWSYPTPQGRAAGDNWFVDFGGAGGAPQMAIGRFPVHDYWDAVRIAEKTIAYVESAAGSGWRDRTLWISDGAAFQDRVTDEVAAEASKLGYEIDVLKPDRNDPSNDRHRERLHEAFNEGQFLVHFIGHGGRFIWRTAPADFEKNRDLFTLEDLDLLEPNERLPIVLAMTCYSGPFDHPGSDSIGEKFLRLEGRGAVAVVAASWRSTPKAAMSSALVSELARSGTVGEAFMRAKQAAGDRHFNELYNLLGDPAIPLYSPAEASNVAGIEGAEESAIQQ